ncbi:MAG TPA: hypothetical protein VGP87_03945 [Gemmatimonadales bacterium]|nr:hypothetical protein [Gemmatimonadales bacterium]
MLALLLCLAVAQPPAEAYRALFVRAAPGRLVELVDLVKARRDSAPAGTRPVLLRHAQGDQWDLVLLQPIGSLSRYFAVDHSGPDPLWDRLVAWQEELFASGPPLEEFQATAGRAGYFHLEIFVALAGERDSLRAERAMENVFLKAVGKPGNFVFTRLAGASWDLFTVGFYRDLQDYAAPTGRTPEQEEAAARAAGFVSREAIGPYLRRFINGHHDTIGSVVR